MIFIRARLNYKGKALFESIAGKIKALIKGNPDETFDFEVAEVPDDIELPLSERELRKYKKSVKTFGPEDLELAGKTLKFKDGSFSIKLTKKGTVDIIEPKESRIMSFSDFDKVNEALPRQQSVEQLKKLRKLTKGIDIGDRVPNLKDQGANIHFMHNPVDSGIESYEDFEKNNKNFIPGWNTNHKMGPFDGRKSS